MRVRLGAREEEAVLAWCGEAFRRGGVAGRFARSRWSSMQTSILADGGREFHTFAFRRPADAVLFRLRWAGQVEIVADGQA